MVTEICSCVAQMPADASPEKRWQIIFEWKANPQASYRSIARKVGVHPSTVSSWIRRYRATKGVNDLPRSGRKSILTPKIVADIKAYAKQNIKTAATSCWRLSLYVKQKFGVVVSARTIRRVLGATDWEYGPGITAPKLQAHHKRKRSSWAAQHSKGRTVFSKWMFTDLKVFLLEKIAGIKGLKFWGPRGDRPLCEISQSRLGVHVYLGLTKTGLTKPIFVTGSQGKLSSFINARTGNLHTGVCTQEYVQEVAPALKAEGDRVFTQGQPRFASLWCYQQDGAPCHKANLTKAALQAMLPNRVVFDWPARSPDLSPIENVWAWMERRLQTSADSFDTVEDLKAGIISVAKSFPRSMCENLINSMPSRLQKVKDRNGAYIGT